MSPEREVGRQIISKLPDVKELADQVPLYNGSKHAWKSKVDELKSVFRGELEKLILIIGPCSADLKSPVMEYCEKLAKLQEDVPNLILVPRVYTNKPRTDGTGYKGKMVHPSPTGEADLIKGLYSIRELHRDIISNTHLVTADEMLNPLLYPYLKDVLGYVAIGARTTTSQIHREVASGEVIVPVGLKNGIEGDINVMFDSIKAVQHPQDILTYNNGSLVHARTTGNQYAHGILRGANLPDKKFKANYHIEDLMYSVSGFEKAHLKNPGLIIDTNHGNSGKKYERQPFIVKSVLESMNEEKSLIGVIKGFMIESYLLDGTQNIKPGEHYEIGRSITDPCLGWEKTERLVKDLSNSYAKLV